MAPPKAYVYMNRSIVLYTYCFNVHLKAIIIMIQEHTNFSKFMAFALSRYIAEIMLKTVAIMLDKNNRIKDEYVFVVRCVSLRRQRLMSIFCNKNSSI